MMWWFGHVFINRKSPESIILAPQYDETNKLKENSAMLKIKLFFAFLKDKYENYIDLRETRQALKSLDDHLLDDIGLSRSDWQALMHGHTVVRQQILSRLPKRRVVTKDALPLADVLPDGLPALEQKVFTSSESAANDCEACAA